MVVEYTGVLCVTVQVIFPVNQFEDDPLYAVNRPLQVVCSN